MEKCCSGDGGMEMERERGDKKVMKGTEYESVQTARA